MVNFVLHQTELPINKSTNFSGQPIISQVLKFIDNKIIYRTGQKHNSDRYYKKFKTFDHLVTTDLSLKKSQK